MTGDELIDVVDQYDVVAATRTLDECLRDGLLHRAVAVLVLRPDGKVLLQRRSKSDRWHPGLLTISSTGHVRSGESYASAAERELQEELGIKAPLKAEKKYLIPVLESGGLTEREWVSFFTTETAAPVTLDPVEVDSTEEVGVEELPMLLDEGGVTPDAVIILRDHFGLD